MTCTSTINSEYCKTVTVNDLQRPKSYMDVMVFFEESHNGIRSKAIPKCHSIIRESYLFIKQWSV